MGSQSTDSGARERRFEQRLAGAMRRREQQHSLPVPADLASAVMFGVMRSAQPAAALAPIPWWKHALVIAGGVAVAAAAAFVSWWVVAWRLYPALAERWGHIEATLASLGSPIDFLFDLYATTPVTDFVAMALLVLTIPLVLAFRLTALGD